jgi:hypothetical protein
MTFRTVKCPLVFPRTRLQTAAERFCYTARHRGGVMYTHNLLHFARHKRMMNL